MRAMFLALALLTSCGPVPVHGDTDSTGGGDTTEAGEPTESGAIPFAGGGVQAGPDTPVYTPAMYDACTKAECDAPATVDRRGWVKYYYHTEYYR
jgi:hypothetical protein